MLIVSKLRIPLGYQSLCSSEKMLLPLLVIHQTPVEDSTTPRKYYYYGVNKQFMMDNRIHTFLPRRPFGITEVLSRSSLV